MGPLISILVPAYQAQKTIRRCLESIVRQTSDDYEVIVINDGSNDNTLAICNEFSDSENFKVLSQSNQGISETRKKLLSYARGEYIQFVDADDWIEPDTIECLKDCVISKKADIIITDFIAEYSQSNKYTSQKPSGYDSTSLIRDISSTRMMGVLWNKLVKKEIYSDIVIPNLRYCEDWVVSFQLFKKVKSFFYLSKAFYHYDNSFIGNSLTRNISKETFRYRIEYTDYLRYLNFHNEYPREYNSQLASIAYIAIIYEIYQRDEFMKYFGEVPFLCTNLSIYKKIILLLSRVFSCSFAKSIDDFVRKIYK